MATQQIHLEAYQDLSTGRCYTTVGFLAVHLAAYGLFTVQYPEFAALLGILGLASYRHGRRLIGRSRKQLLNSLNSHRASPS